MIIAAPFSLNRYVAAGGMSIVDVYVSSTAEVSGSFSFPAAQSGDIIVAVGGCGAGDELELTPTGTTLNLVVTQWGDSSSSIFTGVATGSVSCSYGHQYSGESYVVAYCIRGGAVGASGTAKPAASVELANINAGSLLICAGGVRYSALTLRQIDSSSGTARVLYEADSEEPHTQYIHDWVSTTSGTKTIGATATSSSHAVAIEIEPA
jgi:hypothetical protein